MSTVEDGPKTAPSVVAPGGADSRIEKPAPSILLIEDEILVRMVVADEMRDQGYRVVEAGDAEEARRIMLAQEPISLVISDVNLPGASGLDLGAWIRRDFPEVEIVLTSGLHENAAAAQSVGAFLAKPFRIDALLTLVKRLLQR